MREKTLEALLVQTVKLMGGLAPKENCAADYTGSNPQDDVMERLLTARKGK